MYLREQVEGTSWTVAHDTDTRRIVLTPTPPDWVPPDYAAAWEDSLRVTAAGRCPECGALSPPAAELGEGHPLSSPRPRHDPACRLSDESLARLAGDAMWIAEVTEEAADAIHAYCRDLHDSFLWAGTEER